MTGIDGINFDEIDVIVIKYDQIFTPNKKVCSDRTFPTFEAMQEAIGIELEAERDLAHKNDLPFLAYTVAYVIKPEFAHEITSSDLNEISD